MSELGCASIFIAHVTFPAPEEAEHQQEKAGGRNSRGMLHNPAAFLFNDYCFQKGSAVSAFTCVKTGSVFKCGPGNQIMTNTSHSDQR